MVNKRIRAVVLVCGVVAALLAMPAEGKAWDCLDWLFGGCRTTARVPYVATAYAPVCSPCLPQTCRYVPQTCYRTVCQRVPVTTCLAVTGCDPCTGCPVTTYRPVTTWTTQTRLVPYTSYRLVYSNPCAPCVSAVPSVTYASPAVSSVAAPEPCCGPSVSPPAVPYSQPATSAPSTEGTPKTFLNGSQPTQEETLKPVPEPNTGSMGPTITPQGRTTLLPIRRTAQYYPISSPAKPVPAHMVRLSDAGWRASGN